MIIPPVTAKQVEIEARSPTKKAKTKLISPLYPKLGNIFTSCKNMTNKVRASVKNTKRSMRGSVFFCLFGAYPEAVIISSIASLSFSF